MKIAFITNASGGGAGLATSRLAEAVKEHTSAHPDLINGDRLRRLNAGGASHFSPLSITTRVLTNTLFTLHKPDLIRQPVLDFLCRYNIINIHWTSFCLTEEEIIALAQEKKIIITFHDFFHATGGCHYPAGCVNYLMGCSRCPQVYQEFHNYVENRFRIKNEILHHPNVSLLTPSNFLGSAISIPRSLRLKTHVVRNPYKPVDKELKKFSAREFDLILIADSLEEKRKGIADALRIISRMESVLNIAIVGKIDYTLRELVRPVAINNSVSLMGNIRNHAELVDLYLESKFIFTPSYEDNWPNILAESGSYGVLPIVFNGHGCQEFVEQLGAGLVLDRDEINDSHLHILEYIKQAFPDECILEYSRKVRALHDPATIASQFLAIAAGDHIQSPVGYHFSQIPYKLLLAHANPINKLEHEYVKSSKNLYGTSLVGEFDCSYSTLHDECHNRYRSAIRDAVNNPKRFIEDRIPSKHRFLSPELFQTVENLACIDAFPRSANTYLTYLSSLLIYCNNRNISPESVGNPETLATFLQENLISKRFVHHTHNPFIAAALLSLNVPVLSVVRDPAASIPSLLNYLGESAKPIEIENNIRLFTYWIYFYIDFHSSRNLRVLSFDNVTKSSSSVCDALASLGLIDSSSKLSSENVKQHILSAIENFDRRHHADKASSRIAVPSKHRTSRSIDIRGLPESLIELIKYSSELYGLYCRLYFEE